MADDKIQLTKADTIKDPDSVSRTAKLHELYERLGDVVCFTPAILVVVGGLPVDPVREFLSRFPTDDKDARPFCINLSPSAPPFFSGLGVSELNGELVDWDRRLYGISRARSELCFSYMGGVGIYGENYFASSAQHEIQMPDPTSLFERKTIPVQVFGILRGELIFYLHEHPVLAPYLTSASAADQGAPNFGLNPDRTQIRKTLEDTL